ncbi:formylglycine-generating enzyme family protein [Zhongshania sp.]|uniref:formylglycine-generating enzyme family protein n=1 Tax=Zhongshania sp. TaxID=1971902 RepID=UPI0035663527
MPGLNSGSATTYRLPSAAEWEFAARAATTTKYITGNCVHTGQANYNSAESADRKNRDCDPNSRVYRGKTLAVGSFTANSLGLYDMAGNIAEFTQNCKNDDYTGAPTGGSAWLDGDCSWAVIRGAGRAMRCF